jgi:hypothetical protein
VAASYNADAVAIGDDIALSAGNSEDTPETIGLLAHELTHVARNREPRFVPPIARTADAPNAASAGRADEEQLAGQVERLAREGDRATRAAPALPPLPPAQGDSGMSAHDSSARPPAQTERGMNTLPPPPQPPQPGDRGVWGALPAPSEPLPAWFEEAVTIPRPTANDRRAVTEARPAPEARPAKPASPSPQPRPTTSGPQPGAPSPRPAAPAVQRAGTNRSASAPPQAPFAEGEPRAAPPPDLDALARQVYELLKRRLAAEQRRRG